MKNKTWSLIVGLTLITPLMPIPVFGQTSLPTKETQVAQSESLEQAQQIFRQAGELLKQGEYAEAQGLYEQVFSLMEEALGAEHPDLAQIYFQLGIVDHRQQKFSAASQDYETAVELNPQFWRATVNLGLIAYEQGKIEKAMQYWETAVEIDQEVVEPRLALAIAYYQQGNQKRGFSLGESALGDDVQYADLEFLEENLWGKRLLKDAATFLAQERIQGWVSEVKQANELNQQGIALYKQGKYSEAEPLYEQALAMRKRLYDGDHPDVATSLNNLAGLYEAQGQYSEAEPLLEQALAMKKRLYGGDHPAVAISINNLAVLYESQGRYSEAQPLYEQSLAMWKRLYESDHPDIAISINNLAYFYYSQGRYSEAEPLYEQALAMWKRLYESDHPDVALSLNNLATLYSVQGRYSEAKPLYEQALVMRKRVYDGDHPDVATSLNNLAALYESQGRYSEAEPLSEQALAMTKRLYDADHPDVALSLNNLANIYESQGRYSEAEPLHEQALAMWKRVYDGDHPDVALSLNNLANIYESQGRYSEAKPLYEQALAMWKRVYDGDHLDVATSLNNLALLYDNQGRYSEALASLTEATEIEEAILAENLLIGSERQKQQFLDKFWGTTNYTISFHLQTLPQQEDAARLALTTILRRKGRVLDAMGRALQTLRDQLDPTSQQLFTQLASTQTQLANLSARPGNLQPTQDQREQLAEKIDSLQSQLSQRSAAFAQETTPVTISAVQDAIPQNAALIEFMQYSPYNPKTKEHDTARYAVYVLQPDGTLQWQDLGGAAAIDEQVQQFRTLLNQSGGRGLGAYSVETSDEAIRTVARELDVLIMAPVRELIGEATHLLLSPDSELNLVPFAALVDEQDQYLVERYQITYLTSGRDLLRVQYRDQPPQESLMLAYPDYNNPGILAQTPETESNPTPPTVATVPENERGRRSSELTALEFSALPGTLAEAQALEPMIDDLALFTEEQASENTLKQWKRPRILHLATHGFFLSSQTSNNPEETLSNQENPLLRSGLALAGFNERQSREEDGVLTALEVTGLNLRGTRLVVLSACETGVGETRAGEGVYGLRRAFTLAGAESQLMSLWNVSDEGTQELMVAYYQRLLNGEGRSEALRQVQLEMLQGEERSHPFFWAAFIPSGAWTPLD
ncbi:UNVERIFIED_CONTAM: hypothetical protein BEN50_02795 [Euhalothece sp. KZN 001]